MSFVIAVSLILHPEILLGKGKTSVSKNGQSLQLLAARARAIIYALHPSLLLCWLPFSSVSGKSHSDLRKVVFGHYTAIWHIIFA